MLILLFTICSTVRACADRCKFCRAAATNYISNSCAEFCPQNSECQLGCSECSWQGAKVSCASEIQVQDACPSSASICGDSTFFTSQSGELSAQAGAPPLALCSWVLDLRAAVASDARNVVEVTVALEAITAGEIRFGDVMIAAYSALTLDAVPSLESQEPLVLTFQSASVAQTLVKTLHANYFKVSYWLHLAGETSAKMTLQWSVGLPAVDSGGTLSTVVIVATISGAVVYFSCCVICALASIKAARRRSQIYLDRSGFSMFFGDLQRAASLQIVRPASDDAIEACMPVIDYSCALMEVGEPVCMVCLENLLQGMKVRRLPCKHIFHDACVIAWVKSRATPACPICKANPLDSSRAPDSALEASRALGDEVSTARLRVR